MMVGRNWMKYGIMAAAGLLMGAAVDSSAQVNSVPIDLSAHWNVDGFYIDDNDAIVSGALGLDSGGARVRSWTLPTDFVDLQPNKTADGKTEFLFGPTAEAGVLDSYRPEGEELDIANGKYDFLYVAAMSGNGEFPGNAWKDKDKMTFTYADGASQQIAIGTVNDWFWTPPKWVAPASGNASEIVVDLVMHDSDINEIDYLYYWTASDISAQSHDYGKYRYANGEDYLVYQLPTQAGAKLYMRAWGNMTILISTDDPDTSTTTQELFNSRTAFGKVFPGGGDGYLPPEYTNNILNFDLSQFLPAGTTEFYLKFIDNAPGEAASGTNSNWGARINQLGIFTGPVVESSLGDRLWPNLVRTDGNAPSGGLQLIRKGYRLDNTKELDKITMPNLFPNASPFLTIFGMTLVQGDISTGVPEFMLY